MEDHLNSVPCLLCGSLNVVPFCRISSATEKLLGYLRCTDCELIMRHPRDRLNSEDEANHYGLHDNNVEDAAYQKFVQPLFKAIVENVSPTMCGLDYGAGPGPVLSHLLAKEGFKNLWLEDPFFGSRPFDESLKLKWPECFDFIFACEVIEHFHQPGKEFAKLKARLNPGGSIWAMTHPYDASIKFETWYYRRDPTHVSFYTDKSFELIGQRLGAKRVLRPHPRVVGWFL